MWAMPKLVRLITPVYDSEDVVDAEVAAITVVVIRCALGQRDQQLGPGLDAAQQPGETARA